MKKTSNGKILFNEMTCVQMPALVHLTRLGYTYYGRLFEDMAGTVYDPDTNILKDVFISQFKRLNPNHKGEAEQTLKAIRQPLTDTAALSAVKRIFATLPAAYTDGKNIKAHSEKPTAALEAGIAINNASVTLVHGMSRPIGALFHVPHGISNAMLLEKCLSFALDGTYGRFAELARAIGAADNSVDDKSAAEQLIVKIRELCCTCEIPTPEEYGIDRDDYYAAIPKMSADAIASGSPVNTAKTVSHENIESIYRALYPSDKYQSGDLHF